MKRSVRVDDRFYITRRDSNEQPRAQQCTSELAARRTRLWQGADTAEAPWRGRGTALEDPVRPGASDQEGNTDVIRWQRTLQRPYDATAPLRCGSSLLARGNVGRQPADYYVSEKDIMDPMPRSRERRPRMDTLEYDELAVPSGVDHLSVGEPILDLEDRPLAALVGTVGSEHR